MLSFIFAQAAPTEPFDNAALTKLEGKIPGFRFAGANITDFFSGPYGITNLIFFIAGALIVFYSVSAGIGLMTSVGNPQGVAANKAKLTNAIVGFILLLSAYWIVQLVGTVLGLNGITTEFN